MILIFFRKELTDFIKKPSENYSFIIFILVSISILNAVSFDKKKKLDKINYYSRNFTPSQHAFIDSVCGNNIKCKMKETLLLNGVEIIRKRHGKTHRDHYYIDGVELFND